MNGVDPNTVSDWPYMNQPSFDYYGASPAITALHFDQFEELTWVGSLSGRVTSYIHPTGEKYTSVVGHNGTVHQVLTTEAGVVSISDNSFRYANRGGLVKFSYSNDHMQELRSLVFPYSTNKDIVFAGGSSHLFVFDLHVSRLLKETPIMFGATSVKGSSRMLCCGHTNGLLSFRDPVTLNAEQTLQAHTGGITDLAVYEDYVVTCGWSKGRAEAAFVDPYLKVFDIRMMRPLHNITFTPGPFLCKFHPILPYLVAVSQSGIFQYLDVQDPESATNSPFQPIHLYGGDPYNEDPSEAPVMITSFDISPSGDLLGFGDIHGGIKPWVEIAHKEDEDPDRPTDPTLEEAIINDHCHLVEPVDLAPPIPRISIDDSSSISVIQINPMIPDESLLSYWDSSATFDVPPPPKDIDPTVLPDLRQVDFVGYASNPGSKRHLGKNRHVGHRNRTNSGSLARKLDILLQSKPKKERPPRDYRHMEIKHTKLGFEAYDFAAHNKTYFAGLENILPNSYCNSGLQTLYFIPQLRACMLNHLCKKEFCLTCELGFLFHMLDYANGTNCQASNFLRSFRQIPQASGLGLTEEPADDGVSLVRLMENFNRFILEQLQKESQTNKALTNTPETTNIPIIDQLFGSTSFAHSKCMSCKHETKRETRSFQYDMAYSDTSKENSDSFTSILKTSLKRESHTKAWCETCARYQLTEQKRELISLPNILCVNAAASKADMEFWKSKYDPVKEQNSGTSWLPLKLHVKIGAGGEMNIDEDVSSNPTDTDVEASYQLTAMISHIYDPSKKASRHSHLIAHIKIPTEYHDLHPFNPTMGKTEWYMFNDFHVTTSTIQDVVDLGNKSPCVLYYTRVDINERLPPVPFVNPITEDVFFMDNPIKTKISGALSFEPVKKEDMLKAGDLVAIDAEFVSLGAEETEIRSDGTRAVINPCHFSLARVSCLRGGPVEKDLHPSDRTMDAMDVESSSAVTTTTDATTTPIDDSDQPFLDDYIVTNEPVVDYLTRYSGIVPGDLDPKTSKHHVTTLKHVYMKLRCLLDKGCIFVGHGLAKDFRIINILVPPEQVIDTVELYHLQGQRKISLRFLASCLMNTDIQSETHCSTEDAKTALALYRKYVELKKEGRFEEVLVKIYELGRQTKWTVSPGSNTTI